MPCVVLEDRGVNNIYHWLIYMFANLALISHDDLWVVIPSELQPHADSYVRSCLETIVPSERIVSEVPEGMTRLSHHNVIARYFYETRLCSPSHPQETETGYLFLRKTLLKVAEQPRTLPEVPYLYISRRDNSESIYHQGLNARDVVNEEELLERLPYFKSFCFSKIGFVDQIQLVRDAKIIIAPHGVALIHILAGNKDLKVIEFIANTRSPTCFVQMANFLGLNYRHMEFPADQNENMTVDIDRVVEEVQKLMPNDDLISTMNSLT